MSSVAVSTAQCQHATAVCNTPPSTRTALANRTTNILSHSSSVLHSQTIALAFLLLLICSCRVASIHLGVLSSTNTCGPVARNSRFG